jgi:hypothetical protein
MTATGLQILKPAEKVVDDNEPATPIEIESKLEKLKEERLQMEKDKNKGSAKNGVNTGAAKNLLVRKTSELLDFHWVLDRFSY